MNVINDYKLKYKLGYGSFGEVWKAIHIYKKKEVAIKLERKNKNSLKKETITLRYLSNISCVPSVKYYGTFNSYNYLIMELLGSCIYKYLNNYTDELKFVKVKNVALKMINAIEQVHKLGIIHRDIKPDNFLMTLNNKDVKLIDFGLAKQFITNNGSHKINTKTSTIVGTLRYISYYVHDLNTPSRRDDIISFVYSIVYILYNELPWKDIDYSSKQERYHLTKGIKCNIVNTELYKKIPNKLKELINYSCDLTYDEEPNYEYISFLLKTV